jgi:ribose-phosphate pyrophosphokinase
MIRLFSGSANPVLSAEVSKLLNIPLSQCEIVRFANSEVRVRIVDKVKNKVCIVIQPTANPTDTNLMELLFFADALKRSGAKEIIAFIPYFGYARQNREHRPGEVVSTSVVVRFLEMIGFDEIYTIDLHSEETEGMFTIPFKNLSAFSILGPQVAHYLKDNKNTEKVAIVSPDQGGVERARVFAGNFFHTNYVDVAVIEKKRSLEKIHQTNALNLYGQVRNKTCIIVDDIITSGGTLINAAQFCLKRGAKRVLACIIHHDFSPTAPKTLTSPKNPIERIFTSNTISLRPDQKIPRFKEVSIAPLIAQEIKNLL